MIPIKNLILLPAILILITGLAGCQQHTFEVYPNDFNEYTVVCDHVITIYDDNTEVFETTDTASAIEFILARMDNGVMFKKDSCEKLIFHPADARKIAYQLIEGAPCEGR